VPSANNGLEPQHAPFTQLKSTSCKYAARPRR
jgi:hypothetical protein